MPLSRLLDFSTKENWEANSVSSFDVQPIMLKLKIVEYIFMHIIQT